MLKRTPRPPIPPSTKAIAEQATLALYLILREKFPMLSDGEISAEVARYWAKARQLQRQRRKAS